MKRRVPTASGLAVLVAVIAFATIAAAAQAAPPGAATDLRVTSEACQPDGSVTANIRWTPSELGHQWFDVSARDYFESEYTRTGPYRDDFGELNLVEAEPGVTYYMRVWTWSGTDWLASDTLAYTARGCDSSEVKLHEPPIEEAVVTAAEAGYGLHVVAGLEGGCDEPHSQSVTRQGTLLEVQVLNVRPVDQVCTLIYSTYELDIDLAADFQPGVTYTINVNDFTLTFTPE